MGFFSISLPLQVRAATPDAGAPPDASSIASTDASAPPPSADAGASDASVPASPTDAGTASPDASAPSGDASSGSASASSPRTGTPATAASSEDPNARTFAARIWTSFGYGWRGYGNHRDDPHEGIVFSLGIGVPRLNWGNTATPNNFYLDIPYVVYRHEETGRNIQIVNRPGASMSSMAGPRSSASVDALDLGVLLGWRPWQFFEIALGVELGIAHLAARADPTGEMSGLLVGNSGRSLALFTSADQWGVDVNARLRLGVPNQRIGCSPVALGGGADLSIGYNSWAIRPDWASEANRALAVDSTHGALQIYLGGTFDGGSTCSSSARSSSPSRDGASPAGSTGGSERRGSSGSAEAPTSGAPATDAPAAPTPSVAAPTPSVPRLDAVSFTVPSGTDGTIRAVANADDFNRFFTSQIAASERVTQAMTQAGSQAFTLNLSVRYSSQGAGRIRVASIRVGERTYENGHFPADMPVSTTAIQNILQAVVKQGRPGYTGNRTRPITVTLTRAS